MPPITYQDDDGTLEYRAAPSPPPARAHLRADPARHRLLLLGSMMAQLLERHADALDASCGPDPERTERVLAEAWAQQLGELPSAAGRGS
jgi:hypothetical protein